MLNKVYKLRFPVSPAVLTQTDRNGQLIAGKRCFKKGTQYMLLLRDVNQNKASKVTNTSKLNTKGLLKRIVLHKNY
jgi:hypothetical protein